MGHLGNNLVPANGRNLRVKVAPNLALNLRRRPSLLYLLICTAFAIVVQVAQLVYVFYAPPASSSHSFINHRLVYVLSVCIQSFGMVFCSTMIERSSDEKYYKPEDSNATLSLLWLQRAASVNDQVFESYAIFGRDGRDHMATSRRHYQRDIPRTSVSDFCLMASVYASSAAVVFQLFSLGFLHWSVGSTQIPGTITMLALRGIVHHNLSIYPRTQRLPAGHEVDWLATRSANEECMERL